MPSTFQKARKQISRKRSGNISALHEKSRDSLRLHKATVRDQRLGKLAAAKSRKEQPIVDRVLFARDALSENGGKPLELEAVQSLIEAFLSQFEEEYDSLKKSRRAGRPPTAKEELLKIKTNALQAEYRDGFTLPDLASQDCISTIERWEGSWSTLTTLPWVRVSSAGQVRQTEFPSKGLN